MPIRHLLIAGMLSLLAGAALAQSLGLGIGLHEGRGKTIQIVTVSAATNVTISSVGDFVVKE